MSTRDLIDLAMNGNFGLARQRWIMQLEAILVLPEFEPGRSLPPGWPPGCGV